jgi:hypothetical protein
LNSNKFLPLPERVDVKQNKRPPTKSPALGRTKRPQPPKFRLDAVLLRAPVKTSVCYRASCSRLLRCWRVLKALGGALKSQHRSAL